ncbi:type II secretion system F family protein [Velocimicrobium porci]|uniref:Type II secretion system F family protein n=1 Tax=Velocimicrobium porci TaxID=2606634 RepID=A0A6L5XX60_9FIRM|nr:type II secretion system F family protein [Velocimicrobium porci]MSS63199.1 type II secretion system F family protein [Velocimicrobium porci]
MEKRINYLRQKLQKLSPLDDPTEVFQRFLKRQAFRAILCCLGGILFSFLILFSGRQKELCYKNKIERPPYGEADKQVTLLIKPEDEAIEEEQITFEISPREYNYEEFKREVEKGKQYVNQTILNNNQSFEKVKSNLFFAERVENSFLQLQWHTDKEAVVSSEGEVNNFNLKTKELVTITVTFLYKKYEASYLLMIYVYPPDLSIKEDFRYKLRRAIQLAEEERTNKMVSLPKQIDGRKMIYSEPKLDCKLFVFIPVLIAFIIFEGAKEELKRAEKRRNQQLKIEYPEIMNQIAILLSAGMTIRGVFQKIAEQYEQKGKKGKRNYGYEEIAVTYYEMQNGLSEAEALERMGERIQIMSYRKLMTLLSQNGKKGSRDLINLLEIEAYSAYEERKEMVKTLGEEAGTKLLIPMLIMLIIVLAIIIVPVFMTF